MVDKLGIRSVGIVLVQIHLLPSSFNQKVRFPMDKISSASVYLLNANNLFRFVVIGGEEKNL